MKAVKKKRIDCDSLASQIQNSPTLKAAFGARYSETFLKFVSEYKPELIPEPTK